MDLQLKDRICLVTGASSGVGKGIAETLAAEGARVAINARSRRRLIEVAEGIASASAERPLVIDDDITEYGAPAKLLRTVEEAYGRIDVLVSCTGSAAFVDAVGHEDVWQDAVAINFTAVRRMTKAVLPGMVDRQWGRIINITGSMEPFSVNAATAAKAAAQAWAKGLSREVARSGVTVNTVVPGRIRSGIADGLYPTEEERQRFAAEHIPLGYFGEPSDLAPVVAFLASPLARYITGTIIDVDGGMRRFAH